MSTYPLRKSENRIVLLEYLALAPTEAKKIKKEIPILSLSLCLIIAAHERFLFRIETIGLDELFTDILIVDVPFLLFMKRELSRIIFSHVNLHLYLGNETILISVVGL